MVMRLIIAITSFSNDVPVIVSYHFLYNIAVRSENK